MTTTAGQELRLKYKAVIFDFDGVLVESVDVKTNAYAELYREYGEEVVRQVVEYNRLQGGISRFEKFRHYHKTLLGRELAADEESELCTRFSDIVERAVMGAAWVPGAREFLESYYTERDFFVASGTPEVELKRIIKSRGMERYFKLVLGAPRKKGEIIRKILGHEAIGPHEAVMIGDSLTDYEGAREAGVDFVGRWFAGSSLPEDAVTIRDFNDSPALRGALFL